ncbi:MAG: hypothetical protein AB1416_09990 [Actinomycetota bacterium]
MTRGDALRVVGLCAQADIALVRRDPVAAALLAQAARAAAGMAGGDALAAAAATARAVDLTDRSPGPAACRKAVQALCRIALQDAQAAVLSGA